MVNEIIRGKLRLSARFFVVAAAANELLIWESLSSNHYRTLTAIIFCFYFIFLLCN